VDGYVVQATDTTEARRAEAQRALGDLRIEPMQSLVHETVALLRPTLPATTRLDTALLPATVWVRVNAAQMHQVLVNLITNAHQALPAQGGEIVVGLDLRPDGQVHLWVRDTGTGMDEATRQRVFEPFFTTKAKDEGTGLGLSVVHGIVTAHGGSVAVDSAPGEGTTVHVQLPAALAPGLEAREQPVEAPPVSGPCGTGKGRRVMVLDDDEVMLALSAQLLRRSGFAVTAFVQPEQALSVLESGEAPFDAVVSDLDMPRLNGLEVIRRLRQRQAGQAVVLTSGLIDDLVLAQAQALAVHAVLHKEDLHEGLVPAVVAALEAADPAAAPRPSGFDAATQGA
jgi:CheY-like chemotaxis protein